MICPSWTDNLTSPVLLHSVVEAIAGSVLQEHRMNRVFDLAGCRPLTYLQMMKDTANKMGKRRLFIRVPFRSPLLSRLWVSLITGYPKNLVYPLVESLSHSMIPNPDRAFFPEAVNRTYKELLEKVPMSTRGNSSLFKFKPKGKSVRSVQRLPLPRGKNAAWVSLKYVEWLPQFMRPFIKVIVKDDTLLFYGLGKLRLLELKISHERSNADRQLLYLGKGLMISRQNVGRLEFRVVLNRKYVLAAIHDYSPALPWYFYRFSQAIVHLWIMSSFGRYLAKQDV